MKLFEGLALAYGALSASLALGACNGPQPLEPCNIATETCQEDIYYALVRLRGDGYDPLAGIPPIRTLTLEEYRRELQGDDPPPVDEDDAGTDDDAGVPDEEPEVDPWQVSLQLLGLVPERTSTQQASVNNQVSNVAAFYSSRTQQVTVIDRGNARNDFRDTQLLLHEMVHALQDREFSSSLSDGTTDGSTAQRALTEGEATFYEYLANAEMRDITPERADWDTFYRDWIQGARESLSKTPAPFYGVRWFVYPLGGYYLTKAWLQGGNASVRHAYAEPRRTLAQYIAGYDGTSHADPEALSCEVQTPSDAFERRGFDRFGALQVFGFLTAAGVSDDEAWSIIGKWVDDRVFVYLEPDAETVLVSWRIRFYDAATAESARSAITEELAVRVEAIDSDLLIRGSNDADLTESWPGASRCD